MRAAVIGGAAYHVGKNAQQGQQREEDEQARIEALEQQQMMQSAPAPAPTDIASKLTELKGLLDAGALTQAEFEAAKQKLLAG